MQSGSIDQSVSARNRMVVTIGFTRAARSRCRRLCRAAECDRRGTGRPLWAGGIAHIATTGERREFRRKAANQRRKAPTSVFVEGALFSTGDAHFAQGDGEVCVTAVEMGATVVVRFKIHKDLARKRTFAGPVFSHAGYFADPRNAVPESFLGVMGMPINTKGEIESENLTLAARNAVLNMMTLLQERGFSRGQAYIICSVAVDLRISNVVDVPNYVVSALLPEKIFRGD